MVPDLVVVGGGPVGLAAAIAARQRGLEVLVADRARPPIDKPCGEGVMPDGVSALRILGMPLDSSAAFPFYGIRFTEAGLSAEAYFPAVAGYGLGIRRPVLHQMLVARAAELRVVTRWGEAVTGMSSAGVEIGGRLVPCRWIVGADGRGSRIRRWAGFRPPSSARRRIGLRQHFRTRAWTDFVEVHCHDRGQAVVTPVAPDEICVSLFVNDAGAHVSELVGLYPELRRRLLGVQVSSPARGAISGSSVMPSVVSDRVALIGDAAGAVDALAGEGLSLGFRHAIVLADALAQNDLQRYQRAHRRISRPPELMARLMLLVGGRRALRRRVLSALGSQSRLFAFMLGLHTGVLPLSAVPLGPVAGFLRHLITDRSIAEETPVTI